MGQAGRSPVAGGQWDCPLRGEVNIKEGLMGSGKTCQLPAGCSMRAVVGQRREAGGYAAVKVALGVGESGELPAKRRWLPQCGQQAVSKRLRKRFLSPG